MKSKLTCALLTIWLLLSAECSTTAAVQFKITRPDSSIEVEVLGRSQTFSRQLLSGWVEDAADAVAHYYGTMPMRRVLVRVTPVAGSGVGFSTASEEDGYGLIEARVGVDTSAGQLRRDWTLTHEMLHLAFPLMREEFRWFAEGIATYVEPIARMKNGTVSAEEVWEDLVVRLPGGLRACRGGLDNARSIDGVYWGGALYCLLADIEIRQRTHGRKGLKDALRAIFKSGGTISSDWSFDDAIAAGDKGTGVPVLRELYGRMSERAPAVDLNKIWTDLGVQKSANRVSFNDAAPLSWIRKQITP